tara:strand:+ start:96 stop:440 length:345 start_codon:yes stop_codon:yes gene_type:complete
MNLNYDINLNYKSDEEYQNAFLNFFGLNYYNEEIIHNYLEYLSHTLKKNDTLIRLLSISNNYNITNNDITEFNIVFLLSYECLHLFVPLFKEFINNKNVNFNYYNPLMQKVEAI